MPTLEGRLLFKDLIPGRIAWGLDPRWDKARPYHLHTNPVKQPDGSWTVKVRYELNDGEDRSGLDVKNNVVKVKMDVRALGITPPDGYGEYDGVFVPMFINLIKLQLALFE